MKTENGKKRAVRAYESPIGQIIVSASERGVDEIIFGDEKDIEAFPGENEAINRCFAQLDEYFAGTRCSFDVPLDLEGSPFQLSVWRTLLLIPCGETWSYGRVAAQIGRSRAVRAVGGANHANPVPIIVPCHRVVGSDGKLTGYGGGLWRKEWLLKHESAMRSTG